MALFRRSTAATPAQLGAGTDPARHDSAAPLLASGSADELRDELPDVPDAVGLPGGRGYRLSGGTAMAGPATITDQSTDPAAHVSVGAPDPRHATAGFPLPLDAAETGPELLVNATVPVVEREQTAPDRPRAGSTGADPTRPSLHRLWSFMRPFDKGMADNLAPDGFGKLEQSGPLAGMPISHAAGIGNAIPSASGSGPTGMDPVGVQPNSFRLLPRAWDELLVNVGGPAATGANDPAQEAASAQARRGFRL